MWVVCWILKLHHSLHDTIQFTFSVSFDFKTITFVSSKNCALIMSAEHVSENDCNDDPLAYARAVYERHSEGALLTIAVLQDDIVSVWRWPNDVALARMQCCLHAHYVGPMSDTTDSDSGGFVYNAAGILLNGYLRENFCGEMPTNVMKVLLDFSRE